MLMFLQQGAVAPLQVYCQRRHLHLVVISGLISQTYLHFSIYRFFRRWQPAKPRTGVTTVLFDFESDVWTWFYSNRNHRSIVLTGTIARQFSQEPSLDSFHRNHCSTFPVLFIDRRSLLGHRNLHCVSFILIFQRLVRTEPSDSRMS